MPSTRPSSWGPPWRCSAERMSSREGKYIGGRDSGANAWPAGAPGAVGKGGGLLRALGAISSRGVWAVGSYAPGRLSSSIAPLTEQWDGAAWAFVPSPRHPLTSYNQLSGVSSLSSNDVWAVGSVSPD